MKKIILFNFVDLCCGCDHDGDKLSVKKCKLKLLEKQLDFVIIENKRLISSLESKKVEVENVIAKCLHAYKVLINLD